MLRTIAVLIALLPAVALADMTGQASVIDGDTIEIHGPAAGEDRTRGFGEAARDQQHALSHEARGQGTSDKYWSFCNR